jgi:hypothetical protein
MFTSNATITEGDEVLVKVPEDHYVIIEGNTSGTAAAELMVHIGPSSDVTVANAFTNFVNPLQGTQFTTDFVYFIEKGVTAVALNVAASNGGTWTQKVRLVPRGQ